ncbi:MAG: recombinase family protein [Eubacteriales bacterium]|nr:recombinase family protein [Eubacteriales bacterium]
MATIYYGRVSSKDQNLARQIEAFKRLGADDSEIITDKESGKNFEREGYQALKSVMGLRKGDTLVVKELDRLGRNKSAIKEELEYWKKKGVRVKVIDLPTTMMDIPDGQDWILDMVNNILIEVLGAIAEQERLKIRSRQAEGITAMPRKDGKKVSVRTGKAVGRPSKVDDKVFCEEYKRVESGELRPGEFRKHLGISKATYYEYRKRLNLKV